MCVSGQVLDGSVVGSLGVSLVLLATQNNTSQLVLAYQPKKLILKGRNRKNVFYPKMIREKSIGIYLLGTTKNPLKLRIMINDIREQKIPVPIRIGKIFGQRKI